MCACFLDHITPNRLALFTGIPRIRMLVCRTILFSVIFTSVTLFLSNTQCTSLSYAKLLKNFLHAFKGTKHRQLQSASLLCLSSGASRDRTDDPLLAKQMLSQLSYGPLLSFSALSTHLVGLGGLEPPTPRLSSVCSNQLSYRPSPSSLKSDLRACLLITLVRR